MSNSELQHWLFIWFMVFITSHTIGYCISFLQTAWIIKVIKREVNGHKSGGNNT